MTVQQFAPQFGAFQNRAGAVRRVKVGRWLEERNGREEATVASPMTVVRSRTVRDDGPAWLEKVIDLFNQAIEDARFSDVTLSPAAIRSALQLLGRVMSPDSAVPSVVPRFSGGLQLEWHMLGVDLEVEFEPDGASSAWCAHASGREWEDGVGDLNVARLRKELSMLVPYE